MDISDEEFANISLEQIMTNKDIFKDQDNLNISDADLLNVDTSSYNITINSTNAEDTSDNDSIDLVIETITPNTSTTQSSNDQDNEEPNSQSQLLHHQSSNDQDNEEPSTQSQRLHHPPYHPRTTNNSLSLITPLIQFMVNIEAYKIINNLK